MLVADLVVAVGVVGDDGARDFLVFYVIYSELTLAGFTWKAEFSSLEKFFLKKRPLGLVSQES